MDTGEEAEGKVWSYESPTPSFKDVKGYLSFYAAGVPWECFVDGEKVQPQQGTVLISFVARKSIPVLQGGRRLLRRMGNKRARRPNERRTRHMGMVTDEEK